MKVSPAVWEEREAPRVQKGPLGEVKALLALRSLGRDLKALRLQLTQHLSGCPSSEEWLHVGLIIDRLLFCVYIVFISLSFVAMIIIWVTSYNTS